ncbi:hypothetical protein [Roseovarius sp. Pro17]|uniref:hypothetical protein n=1 Tax=Roseovarius sp. Pro17 TaxID=3108175 RepID=UPI002D76E386|nr:hypothetical protein [Roseovarius sp. Pro17]
MERDCILVWLCRNRLFALLHTRLLAKAETLTAYPFSFQAPIFKTVADGLAMAPQGISFVLVLRAGLFGLSKIIAIAGATLLPIELATRT